MKRNLLLIALPSLLFFACSSNPDVEPQRPVVETENALASTTIEVVEDCTEPAYKIFRETAAMWTQSWLDAFGSPGAEEPFYYPFSQANLTALHNLFPTADGTRVYYGLANSTDTIPFLLMVNIDGCADMGVNASSGENVLVSDIDGQRFITVEEACALTANWRTFVENELKFHTKVNAYNYSWDDIDTLLNSSTDGDLDLHLSYGLRTVSPGDVLFDQDENGPYGSVVYANVMSAGPFELSELALFDFAKPCPQKCDFTSALAIGCIGE